MRPGFGRMAQMAETSETLTARRAKKRLQFFHEKRMDPAAPLEAGADSCGP